LSVVASSAVLAAQPPQPAPPTRPASDAASATAQPSASTPGLRRFGVEKPLPKPAGAFRLATYNLENLFDDADDPALSGRFEDKDMTKPEPHRRALAAAIRAIDADVLAVQEVESKDALLWFRDQFLADMGYVHVASVDAGDERGIEQAVLSRFPITDVTNWPRLPLGGLHPDKAGRNANELAGKPITFHRSPLRVTITVSGIAPAPASPSVTPAFTPSHPYTLTLFVVHQKSGRDWEYWREKEAAATVRLVGDFVADHPDRNVIILGDFNAAPGAPSLRLYADAGLIDAFADADPKDRAVISHASGRAIDRIFFKAAAAREFLPRSRFILGTPALPEDADYRRTPPPDGYASDHYPVVVDLFATDR
jgi:endonuclease/exonuclease/phosphatase family metal-dependent hydrolase